MDCMSHMENCTYAKKLADKKENTYCKSVFQKYFKGAM